MPIALHNAVDDDESSEASYRRITPAEFAKLDPNTVTLLDLRNQPTSPPTRSKVPSMHHSTLWPMCSKPCPQIELS